MERLTEDYRENVRAVSEALAADESFDLIERRVSVGRDELTFFYVDGFAKDGALARLLRFCVGLSGLSGGPDAARRFTEAGLPYGNVEVTRDAGRMITAVLSGLTLVLGSTFGGEAILVDARAYPARPTSRRATA